VPALGEVTLASEFPAAPGLVAAHVAYDVEPIRNKVGRFVAVINLRNERPVLMLVNGYEPLSRFRSRQLLR
jgi:hypothetical protein